MQKIILIFKQFCKKTKKNNVKVQRDMRKVFEPQRSLKKVGHSRQNPVEIMMDKDEVHLGKKNMQAFTY